MPVPCCRHQKFVGAPRRRRRRSFWFLENENLENTRRELDWIPSLHLVVVAAATDGLLLPPAAGEGARSNAGEVARRWRARRRAIPPAWSG